jgi:hypothetical protein
MGNINYQEVHKPLKAQKNPAFTHEESDAEYS